MTGYRVNWGLDLDRRTKERRLADERLCRNIRQRKEAQAAIEHMLSDYWGCGAMSDEFAKGRAAERDALRRLLEHDLAELNREAENLRRRTQSAEMQSAVRQDVLLKLIEKLKLREVKCG